MTRIHRDIYHVEIPMRPRITVHDSAEEEGRKQEHKRLNIHTRDKNKESQKISDSANTIPEESTQEQPNDSAVKQRMKLLLPEGGVFPYTPLQ